MFTDAIRVLPDPVTTEYFDNLIHPDSEPDYALSLLGLACFKKRVENYRGICGVVLTRPSGMSRQTCADLVSCSPKPDKEQVGFYYYNVDMTSDEFNEESLTNRGFKHKETVERLIGEKFEKTKANVFYNTETNEAFVMVNNSSLGLYHLVLSFLPVYYPNIYTTPITKADPEVAVLSSLSKVTSGAFREQIGIALAEYKDEFYLAQINGLLKRFHQKKVDNAKENAERCQRRMNNALDEYSRMVQEYKHAKIMLEGTLACKDVDEAEKELVEYICSNREIRDVEINGSTINFAVATTLKQFSTDAWDVFVRNGGIFNPPYNYYNHGIRYGCVDLPSAFRDKENRKLFLNAIFSEDAEFEVKIAGNYSLNFDDHRMATHRDYNYRTDSYFEHYLPNPHLLIFECLGGYEGKVVQRLHENDIVTAMELCTYSAGSVDLDETEQTFRPFLGMIMSSEKKILRRKDGVDMTPAEALVWLIDKKENKE